MHGMVRTRGRRPRVGLGRFTAAVLAAVFCGVLLAGCTSASNSGGYADVAAGENAAAATTMAGGAAGVAPPGESGSGVGGDSQGAPTTAAGPDGSGAADTPLVDDRQIIRTATIALQITVQPGKDDEATTAALTAAASAAAVKVRALAPGTGGYVSASDGGGATISVTLRIPASSYDTVMNGLAGIGDVTSRIEKTDDVTDQMVDVTSRIATMKASVDRIRALLAKADKIEDVISIESELTQREADLESLENRQAALGNQVALSTIAVTITAVTPKDVVVAAEPERHGFLAGLAGGWHALLSFGTWLGSVIGALLPFLPVVAVVVAVALWISRRRRRAVVPAPAVTGPGADTGPGAAGNPEAGVVSK